MTNKFLLMTSTILVLFVIPLIVAETVSASPLESFAENPIPYWTDNSLDTDLSWDSAVQTVTVEYEEQYELGYWEDGSNVGEWVKYATCEAGDSVTTDGTSVVLKFDNNANPDWDNFYTNEPNLASGTYDLEIKIMRNISVAVNLKWYTLDSKTGTFAASTVTPTVGAWVVYHIAITQAVQCFEVYAMTTTADLKVSIDYIRISADVGSLDLRVPIMRQATQSIELMGNFSGLNSPVRFQFYDNNSASGLWCDVTDHNVTFSDASYAEFTDVARINFTLNEEIRISKIYVYAQNMTLIDYYSDYIGLANNDYLRMNDSVFEGSFQLWYLQGDVAYLEEINDMTGDLFYELFLSLEMWGYFGPLALVVIGYFISKKERGLGIFFIIVDSLIIATYLTLVEATPQYWWHILILILGVIQCTFRLVGR